MKQRFFLIILTVLLGTVVAISLIQGVAVMNERRHLVSQQIERLAAVLQSSDHSAQRIALLEREGNLISKGLGADRWYPIIRIFNSRGQVEYENEHAVEMGNFPQTAGWQKVLHDGHVGKVLTIKVPEHGERLQVGLILDDDIVRWREMSAEVLLYAACVLTLVILISYWLTSALLGPLSRLVQYLEHHASHGITESGTLPALPFARKKNRDEVDRLATALTKLMSQVRENVQLTHFRSAQLTHELKTPLTIVRNLVETARTAPERAREKALDESLQEIDRLADTIASFMEWSRFENTPGAPAIHAVKLASTADEVSRKIALIHPGRIHFQADNDETVFGAPTHVEQIVRNLAMNAVRYSPEGSSVQIVVEGAKISVRDEGPGIPDSVLSRLGIPFNIPPGQTGTGTGLGLAWVHAICRKYGWRLSFQKLALGTSATVEMVPPAR